MAQNKECRQTRLRNRYRGGKMRWGEKERKEGTARDGNTEQ